MPVPCKPGQFLTMAQAHAALRQAGFPENEIVDMGAIGKAESNLCPFAYNPSGENSIGIWQINMNAHGTKFGTREQLFNPLTNAKAAYAIYKPNKSKRPWGAYTDGRYKQYLAESRAAYSGNNSNVIISSISPNLISNTLTPNTTANSNALIYIGAGIAAFIILTR